MKYKKQGLEWTEEDEKKLAKIMETMDQIGPARFKKYEKEFDRNAHAIYCKAYIIKYKGFKESYPTVEHIRDEGIEPGKRRSSKSEVAKVPEIYVIEKEQDSGFILTVESGNHKGIFRFSESIKITIEKE